MGMAGSLAFAATIFAAAAAPAPTLERVQSPAVSAGAMAPRLVRLGSSLGLSWVESPAEGARRLRFARFEKGAWTEPATITESRILIANWADTPSVIGAGDGALIASWAEQHGEDAHASDVVLGRSTDNGKTWQRLGLVNDDGTATEHGFTTLLPDDKGALVAWLDGRQAASAGPMTLRAGRAGKTVQSSVLDPRVCDCCGTASALTSSGPVIVYRDRTETEVRDIAIVRRVQGKWTEPAVIHADGWSIPGCPVNGPAVAAQGKTVVVAWYTYAESQPRVKASFSKDSGATFGDAIEIDAPRGAIAPIGRVDVSLDDRGFALVSWMTSNREAGELLARQVSSDGKRGAVVPIARSESGRQAGFPRQLRDAKDVLFAWTEPTGVQLARLGLTAIPLPVEETKPKAAAPVAPAPARKAPDVAVRTIDGAEISLPAMRKGPVLVNFWATWCEPCRMELPVLSQLHSEHQARGLSVIGVSLDARKTASEVKTFAARRGVTFPLWHDPQENLASAFGVQTLPASFLVDRNGDVVWSATGAIVAGDTGLAAAINAALAR